MQALGASYSPSMGYPFAGYYRLPMSFLKPSNCPSKRALAIKACKTYATARVIFKIIRLPTLLDSETLFKGMPLAGQGTW